MELINTSYDISINDKKCHIFLVIGDDKQMIELERLEDLSKLEINHINKSSLKDITQITVDTNLPITQRLIKFLEDIENPYCFLVGSSAVKIEFASGGQKLQTCLKNHFITQRNRTFE